MSALRPCKCCGEDEHLQTMPEYDEDWSFTSTGQIKRTSTGAYAVDYVDHVRCMICGTQAPHQTWNAQSDEHGADWADRRAATVAAWADHDAAKRIVLTYIEARTGAPVEILDTWPRRKALGSPTDVLAAIEAASGVKRSDAEPYSIEGIVSALAGRLVLRAVDGKS